MEILICGKQSFVSKKGDQCYILHYLTNNENVNGKACETRFVNSDIFNKAVLNGRYRIIWNAYSNGRAYIDDIEALVNG